MQIMRYLITKLDIMWVNSEVIWVKFRILYTEMQFLMPLASKYLVI